MSLRAQIEGRRLDSTLEKSFRQVKHKVEEQVVLRDMLRLEGCNDEVNSALVSDDVLELYLRFVDCINEVKRA
jgi:hypothetical protein